MSSIKDVNKAMKDWEKACRALSRTNWKLKDQPHLQNDEDFCKKLFRLEENVQSAIKTYKKVKSELVLD